MTFNRIKHACTFLLTPIALTLSAQSHAQVIMIDDTIDFDTNIIKDYLLISKSFENTEGTAISVATDGNKLGHVSQLKDSAPDIPTLADDILPSPVTVNPTYDGDAAILSTNDGFNYTDINVYGKLGVVCNQSAANCSDDVNDTDFDNQDGLNDQQITVGRGIEQFDLGAGVPSFDDFSDQINIARDALMALQAMGGTEIDTDDGYIKSDTSIHLMEGLNLFYFEDGVDVTLEASLMFRAPDDAAAGDRQAIVFTPNDKNFKISNGNILVDDDMGLMDVLFVSLNQDNSGHFDFSNATINGISFWDMYRDVGALNVNQSDPSEVVWNNVSGCTQILGDKINLSSEIFLSNCGFRGVSLPPPPPPPTTASEPENTALFSLMLMAIGFATHRRRQSK